MHVMRKVLVISLIAFTTRLHAKGTDGQNLTDELIKKMLDRTLITSPIQDRGLDFTTLEKHIATPSLAQAPSRNPSLRVLKGGRGGELRPVKVGPLSTQRLITFRAGESDVEPSQSDTWASEMSPSAKDSHQNKLHVPKRKELERKAKEPAQQKPMTMRVNCAPEELGGECELTFELQLTLDSAEASEVHWQKAKSIEGLPVVAVESVAKDSEAYRHGIRPGMVVKSFLVDSESNEDQNSPPAAIDLMDVEDGIRRARHTILFTMLEGVKLTSAMTMTEEDKHSSAAASPLRNAVESIEKQDIEEANGEQMTEDDKYSAAANSLRNAFESTEKQEIEEAKDEPHAGGGLDLSVMGLLFGAAVLPPAAIVAVMMSGLDTVSGFPPH